ncbi:MAG TPA: ABC-2 transporter permease [Mobilitalea sp.]|nr:ABC-2 transporter permease [Mobilitalea sp.]
MTGIIIKDFINLKKNFKTYPIIVVIYALMAYLEKDAGFFGPVFTIVFSMLILTTYSYDEVAKWDGYALTMPITRANIIQGKYILVFIMSVAGFLFSSLFTAILNIVLEKENVFQGIQACGIGGILAFAYYCIAIPVITKMGIEKARFIFLAIYFIPFALVMMISKGLKSGELSIPEQLMRIGDFLMDNIYIVIPLILLAMFVISYNTSIRIYTKKEF